MEKEEGGDGASDRPIHLKCQLQLIRDVTLIMIARYNGDPERIQLKKGTNLTLVNDRQIFCATDKGCGNGPLVRIDETKGIEILEKYVGRSVIIPARFLKIHPNEL